MVREVCAEAVVNAEADEVLILSVRSTLSLLSNATVPGSKKPRQEPAFSKGMLNRKYRNFCLQSTGLPNAFERYTLKLLSTPKNLITVNLTRGTMETVIL